MKKCVFTRKNKMKKVFMNNGFVCFEATIAESKFRKVAYFKNGKEGEK